MLFGPRRALEFISTIWNYEDEVAEHLGSQLKVAQPLVTVRPESQTSDASVHIAYPRLETLSRET